MASPGAGALPSAGISLVGANTGWSFPACWSLVTWLISWAGMAARRYGPLYQPRTYASCPSAWLIMMAALVALPALLSSGSWASNWYISVLALGESGGVVVSAGWFSATARPMAASVAADRSLFCSSPPAICWMRKKPSTVITAAEKNSVLPTTRSCSDRLHRVCSAASTARHQAGTAAARRCSGGGGPPGSGQAAYGKDTGARGVSPAGSRCLLHSPSSLDGAEPARRGGFTP